MAVANENASAQPMTFLGLGAFLSFDDRLGLTAQEFMGIEI
jgi:hypothetical protein